jgi:hypothetical protein
MSDRSEVVASWRSRLSASEEQLAHGSPHLQWLRRMYIRVYRFLLSQYGEASDSPPVSETPVSLMPLVDNTDRHGRPPKQPGKIQAILKDIHVANERLDKPGPLAKGMAPGSWLVVASRREKWIPGRCLNALRENGIPARLTRSGGDVAVEVEAKDLESASRILHHARRDLTYARKPPPLLVLALIATIVGAGFGAFAGLFIAIPVAAASDGGTVAPWIVIAMTALGAGAGLACWTPRLSSTWYEYSYRYSLPRKRPVEIEIVQQAAKTPDDAFPACFGAFCGMIIGVYLWGVAVFSDRFAGVGYELAQWTPVVIAVGCLIGLILGRAFSRWRN